VFGENCVSFEVMWYLRLGRASNITHKRYVHVRDSETQDINESMGIESHSVGRELLK